MRTQTPDLHALVARLEKLEEQHRRLLRQHRCMKWAVAVLLLGAALVGSVPRGQAGPPKGNVVEAERFVLRDAEGKERAVWGVGREGPHLSLLDTEARGRVVLAVTKGGAYLHLQDGDNRPRLELTAETGWSPLNVNDDDTLRATVGWGREPMLGLFDEKGGKVIEVVKEGHRLALYDADDQVTFSKP
jgi:hypothetical protein